MAPDYRTPVATPPTVCCATHPGPAGRRRWWLHPAAFLVVLALLLPASRAAAATSSLAQKLRPLNVILITIDTLRADVLGAYGGDAQTPNLDRLAREGVVFERCISQTPLTLPSHATILSGTYPAFNGVRDNGGSVVPGELELVSEVLHDRGFATSAFVAAYILHSKWGLDQGFDHYDDTFDRRRFKTLLLQNSKRAEEVMAAAEEWLHGHRNERFFTWIHLFDPHAPYDPPPPFDHDPRHPYRGEVEYTDHAVGQLLTFLAKEGLLDRCLIVVAGDHGESLGEHGEHEHGFFVYDATTRVPLIARAPFPLPITRWHGLVELVDVAPTILDAVGAPIPSSYQGRSLMDVMSGGTTGDGATAYTETYYPRTHYGWSDLKALYRGELKLVAAPREELYNLRADPGERVNLATDPAYAQRRAAMERTLEEEEMRQARGALAAGTATVSAEDAAALRALGYVTSSVDTSGATNLADPKDRIGVFNRLADAGAAMEAGRLAEAATTAQAVIGDEPGLLEAHLLLANARQRAGRYRDALTELDRVLTMQPGLDFAMIDVMSCLLNLGATDEAIQRGTDFSRRFPGDPVLHEQLGDALFAAGSYDRALDELETSIAIDPAAPTLTKVGEIHVIQGDLTAARAALARALALDSSAPGPRYFLGQVAERQGRPDEALQLYEQELDVNPREFRAAFRAAAILGEGRRYDDAIRYGRMAIDANPRFNLPYFMVARYLRDSSGDLQEAIRLCREGIDAAPKERSALLGYQILLSLLERTGDRAAFERYAGEAKELARTLGAPTAPESRR